MSMCLYRKITITTEPISFYITLQLLIDPGKVLNYLGKGTITLGTNSKKIHNYRDATHVKMLIAFENEEHMPMQYLYAIINTPRYFHIFTIHTLIIVFGCFQIRFFLQILSPSQLPGLSQLSANMNMNFKLEALVKIMIAKKAQ